MPRRRVVVALTAAWVLLLGLALGTMASSARAEGLQDNGTLHIVVPSAGASGPAGPVGTYVTIQATGLTPSAIYKLGIALKDAGCEGGFADLGQPATADATGSFNATFQWPTSASDTGSSYDVCAQSQTDNSFVQSDSAFTVLGAKAPSISIKRVAPPPGTGTPATQTTPQPLPSGVYQAGDYVQITGKNFLPGGTTLAVYLTANQIKSAQDVQGLTPLPGADQSSITSDNNGGFVAIVQIPAQTQSPAQYYLYVASGDSDTNTKAPPSLEAFKQILVEPAAPSPTATPTNTPVTPTVSSTTTTGNGGGNSGGSNKPTGLIVGLGIASVILFILGVILLASAATTSTPRPQQR